MSTVLTVMALVFGGAVVLAVALGPLVAAASAYNLNLRWYWWVAVWVWTLTCIGAVAGCGALYVQKHPDRGANACADRGGVWSVVGEHPVLVGKVVTQHTDYACVMPR